ncbi:helix-turn-helix transcriptional regulator [Microbacterium schleiferi]|uniref:Helix-turn-helix transcriptional regulator n=1 Tax=Microbacterium schleiferi TaxID=69362 RepID=A0A7S8RGM5_9MICO|nr:helix-turn-helix domain-containing protein [Microbacterium schleiferi]QPE03441.1 helix-turn-helix transcriptional regulator [Microbacterium schleiferi]
MDAQDRSPGDAPPRIGDAPPRIGDARELDVGALRALAHPLRVQIYDILSQFGPQTASSLAEQLGESSGATSYHLRALAKHDLIREVPDRGTARERWWERPTGAVSMTSPTAVKTPAGRAASQVVISEFYRRRNRQLEDFIADNLRKDPDEWTAMLSTATVRMTDTQFEQLVHDLEAVIDDYVARYREQEGDGVRPFTVRTDVFPLTDRRSS